MLYRRILNIYTLIIINLEAPGQKGKIITFIKIKTKY